MSKAKSGRQWRDGHDADEYVRLARRHGYRSRASYKLLEMNDKFGLIKPGMQIVDLGAAPGGWSQVVAGLIGGAGEIYALDLLEMEPLPGVSFIHGDFTTDEVFEDLLVRTGGRGIDLVISDMAPNLSGMKAIDQPRVAYLVELAVDYADRVLRPGGALLAKCFEGEGIDQIRTLFRERFGKVSNFKPRASRPKSRELYLIGRNYGAQAP